MTRKTLTSTAAALLGIIIGASAIGVVAASAPTDPQPQPAAIAPVEATPTPTAEPTTEPVATETPTPPPTLTAKPLPAPVTATPTPPSPDCKLNNRAGGPETGPVWVCPGDPMYDPGTPAYTPPVLNCAPWMSPGILNEHGDPTTCLWNQPGPGGVLEFKACESEDSINCFWDAQQRGNGVGRSFIDINGHHLYE